MDGQGFNLRTLNYLGSKLRLLDFIQEQVARVTPMDARVCDLFAGSGCVSYRLSADFPVISCDIQRYSTVICEALLLQHSIAESEICSFMTLLNERSGVTLDNVFAPLVQMETDAIKEKNACVLADIIEHGSLEVFRQERQTSTISDVQEKVCDDFMKAGLKDSETFISRHYGGVYFSYKQALQIDTIMSAIRKRVPESHRSVFLAALLSTASDVVDTVGKHFAQPIRARDSNGNVKSLVYSKALRDKTMDVFALYEEWLRRYAFLPKGGHANLTLQGDFMDCLKSIPDDVQTIYADPPYTREHYSRFYHVLETIARGDMPDISTVKAHGVTRISNGLYRNDRHQSPFCIRSKAPDAFGAMFREVAAAHRNLLLSYSPYDETKKTHPRVVTMRQLVSWTKRYFTDVEVVSAGRFAHNKLNSTEHFLESSDEAEMLIVCTGAQGG